MASLPRLDESDREIRSPAAAVPRALSGRKNGDTGRQNLSQCCIEKPGASRAQFGTRSRRDRV